MRSAWSKVLRGMAIAVDGVADLVEGSEPAVEAAEQASPEQPMIDKNVLTEILGIVARGMGADAGVAQPSKATVEGAEIEIPEAPATPQGMGSDPDDTVIPKVENGVPILECPELHRQRNEDRRRRVLRQDPVNAIAVIAYWARHLVDIPSRAEEWVRCIEAVPGSAGDRFNRALHMGMPELRRYAGYFDEIHRDVEEAKKVAAALKANKPELADDLLDPDRLGRLWFQIGDRPEVDALTELPEPDGVVKPLGDEHIDGPPGSTGDADEEAQSFLSVEDITGGEIPEADDAEVAGILEAFDAENGREGDDAKPVEHAAVRPRMSVLPSVVDDEEVEAAPVPEESSG